VEIILDDSISPAFGIAAEDDHDPAGFPASGVSDRFFLVLPGFWAGRMGVKLRG
jgi:hypothetical protein